MAYALSPTKVPKLAQAAASKDPYGLAPNNRAGPLGIGATFAAPQKPATTPKVGGIGTVGTPIVDYSTPSAVPPNGPSTAPSAAEVNSYDLSTDPAYQQIQALVGQSNSQATASALKQRQDLLLAYGDSNLASAVLGKDDPIAAAAGQNPTSTVAQLGQSRDRNLKTLEDQLNAANLGYSGYRVTQETQAGQDYQNALANAAAALNQNLDTVGSNLAAALAGNNQQLVSGINSAADRASQASIASGTDPGAVDPNALAPAAGSGLSIAEGLDPAIAFALAARQRQNA